MSDLAFSEKFLANRNASSSGQHQPSAPAIKSGVHGSSASSDEMSQMKQEIVQMKRQIKEIHAQLGVFGQQLATVKPNIIYTKDFDSAEFSAWLEQLMQEKNAIVVVGATWCQFCNRQKEELEKLPTGTLSYVVYVDDDTRMDTKMVPALRGMGLEMEGFPTIYKTTGDGRLEEISVGFATADELSSRL